jgi:hypothetical protein
MDPETAKVIGALFVAIVNSLTDEHRAEICATVLRTAEDPDRDPGSREFLLAIYHAATADPAQLAIETERMRNGGRPQLKIITGGDAA